MKKKEKINDYMQKNKLQLEEIIKDYSNYIYTIIQNKVGNKMPEEDIEEIISDVFLTLWNNQAKLDVDRKLSSYIAGITKNLVKKKYRNLKNYENIEDFEEAFVISENITIYSEIEEQNEEIIKELNNMKEDEQKIFSMYYFEGKQIKEIAEILDFSVSKVKMKLSRTRKKLQKKLEERGM